VAVYTHVINFSTFIKQRRITASSEQIKKERKKRKRKERKEERGAWQGMRKAN
jgi:hypothetical protein